MVELSEENEEFEDELALEPFENEELDAEFKFEAADGIDASTGCTMTTKGITSAIKKAIAATK